uniref:Isoform 2 of PIH1 domain-containing protein 2 n=1 Tax=Mus musculus TaxID=10090 RepID=Q8CHR9-2
MTVSSKGLLTHISQFWNMLDDLAENDPERYRNFIQQELKDGKQLCVNPEPQLCIQTKILKPNEKVLFINLCQWERIPAPQSATRPVPMLIPSLMLPTILVFCKRQKKTKGSKIS